MLDAFKSNSTGELADSDLRSEYLIGLSKYENNKINKAFNNYGVALLDRLSIETSDVDINNLDQYYIIPRSSV